MQTIDGRPVYAATDLVGYLACEHLTALERAALAGLVHRPMRDDPELDVIRQRGFEHEARYLADLEAEGRTVVEIAPRRLHRGPRRPAARPRQPRRSPRWPPAPTSSTRPRSSTARWRGHADFLLRVDDPDRPSVWGPWHYEVADTKLARHVKASAVLQICSYIDQLERLQGVRPEWMHVALGGSARTVERLRVDDYMAYYRERPRPIPRDASRTDARSPIPPAGHLPRAGRPLRRLPLGGGVRRSTSRRRPPEPRRGHHRRASGAPSTTRGVPTLEALGDLPLPIGAAASRGRRGRARPGPRAGPDPARRATRAAAPLRAARSRTPASRSTRERGLAILPPPSPGDLFFDIEGDPYALDDGLDYLFGVLDVDGDVPRDLVARRGGRVHPRPASGAPSSA